MQTHQPSDLQHAYAASPVRRGRWVATLAAAALLAVPGRLALAQKVVNVPDEDNGLLQYVIAALIMLVISVTGFLKAHRSHRA